MGMIADIMGSHLGRTVRPQVPPRPVRTIGLRLAGVDLPGPGGGAHDRAVSDKRAGHAR
jgi:hypothetical protein